MDELDLLDWKRRVFTLYASARAAADPAAAHAGWIRARDELFAEHPQSPLAGPGRAGFRGLAYYGYDPTLRRLADVVPADEELRRIGASDGGSIVFRRFAAARFELGGDLRSLDLFWLEGYGGGVFLPFADATSGHETYGGGRYLLDTVKGADLGVEDGRLVLDFNFAYNPSCAYDSRWACPLAPPGSRLGVPVRAGERLVP